MNNLGALLRAAREAAGVSLSALAGRTHYSKPLLGMLETGKRAVRPEHVRAYEQALGIDVERLAATAIAPHRVDRGSLADTATILGATRRLEDATSASAVLPAVQGLAQFGVALTLSAGSDLSQQTAALASEINQYRGSLELATGNMTAADKSLNDAISLAAESNSPDRLVHGLSFKAYAALINGRTTDAATLADRSLAVQGVHPLLRVYDLYQRARILAAAKESLAAQHALIVADRAAEAASDEEPPESGYWYTEGLWGLHRGRVLWLTGQQKQGAREVLAGLAAMPDEHREAEWATTWVRTVLGDNYATEEW
ncbi:Helix-turn-helix domain-containing protein [Actinokineospora iranica]|uniref:Helix-turn-helix domain-containing protein n=1 Tax=Actinokineospora iranica TaxID=1271860 RepID=A0A1G6SP54_9PSEU|nr:Helix-turn-helix domain-containing protein [Actinokineospora iranica]